MVRNQLGKVLRINVDGTGDGPYGTYSIPSSNPFVGRSGRDEIWSYGFRNPWRLSFDRANGNLFVADVGQGSWEEVDRESYGQAGGRNYGWRVMEGRHCYNATTCNKSGKTLPITEYSHGTAAARSPAASCTAAPPSRSWWATTSSPTSAAGASGRS